MSNNSIQPQALSIDLAHIRLAALKWGNGKKIRLALHGWLDNAMSFAPIAPYLIDDEHCLLALELAGHGHSQHRPVGSGYFFSDYVRDVMLVAQALNIDELDIVSHSLGAAVSTMLAGIFNEQVRRMVCIECYGVPLTADSENMPQRMRDRLLGLDYMTHQSASTYRSIETLIKARIQAGKMQAENAERLIRRNIEKLDTGEYRFISDRRLKVAQPQLIDEAQMLSYIRNIHAKVLVIETDNGLSPKWSFLPERYAQTKDITVKRINGDHHPHMDDPQTVAELIQAFWAQTSLI